MRPSQKRQFHAGCLEHRDRCDCEILDSKSGGIKNRDLILALTLPFTNHNLSQCSRNHPRLVEPSADGYVNLSRVECLCRIVHEDAGPVQDLRVEFLFSGCIGTNGLDMRARVYPFTPDDGGAGLRLQTLTLKRDSS